jgi:BMFP domain-containing protein YqiC
MGIFKRKKQHKSQQLEPAGVAEQVFDEQYREELRQAGREHFQKILDANSTDLKQDMDAILEQLTGSLRRHLASQLDLAITRVNNDISNQLKEQMIEYNRVSSEAQELVIQSLSRNAQAVHEKYQQMSSNLQQVVANQEVMMVGVFQDNQSRVSAIQSEQEKSFEYLRASLESARHQSEELAQALRQSAEEQSHKLDAIYRENIDTTSQIKQSQETAIATLQQTVAGLERQYAQLQQLLDQSIAKQKAMAAEMIDENMARILEHYLIGALGERSDLVRDLPNILEKMDEHKQAMMDDMKL